MTVRKSPRLEPFKADPSWDKWHDCDAEGYCALTMLKTGFGKLFCRNGAGN